MSAVRRFAAVTAAAAGLAALSLLPAILAAPSAAAAPVIPASALPSDCTYTTSYSGGFTTQSLTCTARPKTQVWEQEAVCVVFPGPKYYTLYGNRVTGDGTSSITCSGTFETPSFYVVS